MTRTPQTITVLAILLLAVLCFAFTHSEPPVKSSQLNANKEKNTSPIISSSFKCDDSIPLIRINGEPSQQPPQMVSLQIQDRSMVIQTYTSPSGSKIMFDLICKNHQQLTMQLAKADTILWTTDVIIEGYQRQMLEMGTRKTGRYDLQILSLSGDHLKLLQILKSG